MPLRHVLAHVTPGIFNLEVLDEQRGTLSKTIKQRPWIYHGEINRHMREKTQKPRVGKTTYMQDMNLSFDTIVKKPRSNPKTQTDR